MRNDFGMGHGEERVQQGQLVFLQVERRGHVSAGQCCAGCLGEGKFLPVVPFPSEPASFFSIMETNHCNAHILSGWRCLIRAIIISAEALPASLHASAVVPKHK